MLHFLILFVRVIICLFQIGDEDKGDIPIDSMEAVTGYDAMDSMIPPPPVYEEYVEPPPPDFTAQ